MNMNLVGTNISFKRISEEAIPECNNAEKQESMNAQNAKRTNQLKEARMQKRRKCRKRRTCRKQSCYRSFKEANKLEAGCFVESSAATREYFVQEHVWTNKLHQPMDK